MEFPSCTFVSFVVKAVAFDLLRQFLFSLNHQVRIRMGRRGSRLSSAYGDEIVSCTDEPVSSLVDVAEIARTECQLHMLLLAGFQVNALKAAERLQRCARYLREADVELSHFVAVPLARVLNVHLDVQRTA